MLTVHHAPASDQHAYLNSIVTPAASTALLTAGGGRKSRGMGTHVSSSLAIPMTSTRKPRMLFLMHCCQLYSYLRLRRQPAPSRGRLLGAPRPAAQASWPGGSRQPPALGAARLPGPAQNSLQSLGPAALHASRWAALRSGSRLLQVRAQPASWLACGKQRRCPPWQPTEPAARPRRRQHRRGLGPGGCPLLSSQLARGRQSVGRRRPLVPSLPVLALPPCADSDW
jgi:hypothetical protein